MYFIFCQKRKGKGRKLSNLIEGSYKGCPHQEDWEVSLTPAGRRVKSVPSHPDEPMDPPLLMPSQCGFFEIKCAFALQFLRDSSLFPSNLLVN